jgi:membrane associated rhomboid family serine protease
LFTHLFLHVGVQHLIGNLLPLIAFSLLLESVLSSFEVIAVFVASGVVGGALFSLLNPGAMLVGASAAISGLMAACAAAKPKAALALLVAVPLLVSFAAVPAVAFAEQAFERGLNEKQAALQGEVASLVAQNRTVEAAAANASLQAVAAQAEQTTEGREREASTPTDFAVHAFGAIAGVLFLWFARRDVVREGLREYESLGGELFALFAAAKSFFAGAGGARWRARRASRRQPRPPRRQRRRA